MGGAQRVGPFDQHVVQGARARGIGGEHGAREGPGAGSGVDHHELVGITELVPPRVQRASEDGAEQRADLGAGKEVAAPPGPPAGRVEAALRVIEGDVDDLVVRERSFAANALAELGGYFTSDEISPKRTSMLG